MNPIVVCSCKQCLFTAIARIYGALGLPPQVMVTHIEVRIFK